ncbi:ubiquitin carboxyl-terminal hydrolase 16 [Rhinatrema bivittatum]|uniref:ubiquitin carboxyl-terminal hydrolase 16 n=1 Tax=Rhinatrema bivittatum TaxID=194408 RepID=UPI00112CCF5B|nr:ubiquitin carboxyl-terminal hydrolase 16 [Rhinatrema bivittatum]
MGKKRSRNRMAQPPECADILEPVCRHIRKGLEQGNLKKALLNVDWDICQDCQTDNKAKYNSEEEPAESYSVWLCLKCGHRGCDRNSQDQHALKHYSIPRSDSHCLVLSLGDWNVWCYMCDNEVPYSSSNRLGQLVDYIKKQALTETPSTISKEQETKDLENKKLEKDSKNELEKEKKSGKGKAEKEALLPPGSRGVLKGLSNQGNTCFFNAVLQNLYQTSILRELLKEVKEFTKDLCLRRPDSTRPFILEEPLVVNLEQIPGPLTTAVCQFLTEMQETKEATVTPKELFSQVCKKAVRFKGYQQQDSQELLRYLLDGMRAEEIQRISAAVIKTRKDSAEKIEEEELKKKMKEYEKKRAIPNFVDRIFGGELTSTIMCEECRSVSLVHETFLDLSLPVLDDQDDKKSTGQKNVKVIYENKNEEDEDGYMKGKIDTPTAPSKHMQKKARKQARKQAKNLRQQQKLQEKLLHLSDVYQNYKEETSQEGTKKMQQEAKSSNQDEELGISQTDLNHEKNIVFMLGEQKNGSGSEEEMESKMNTENTLASLYSSTERGSSLDSVEEDIVNAINKLNLRSVLEPSDAHVSIFESQTSGRKLYEIVNENTGMAFSSLAERKNIKTCECSVQRCLYQFTQNEKLSESNKLLCNECTRRQLSERGKKKHVYTSAIKQMLISLPPPILTLHLKRFQQAGFNLRKVTKHVQFPEVLDLAPFCTLKSKSVAEGETRVLYSLYGLVEHSGTMRSGHYTAYVKVRTANTSLSDLVMHEIMPQGSSTESLKGQWFHISDAHVQAVPTTKVLSSQAYLLFYERIL